MTPDELLKQLKEHANRQKKRNLELIHQICKDQHERGSKDFSIAMIGKLSEQQQGPKAQSIRNKGGIEFRALIKSWAEYAGGSHVKIFEQKKTSPYYDLLRQIDRPDIRAVFSKVLADNKQLRAEIDIMRKLMNKGESKLIIDKRPKEVQPSQGQVAILSPVKDFNESEIKALHNSVSDHFFADQGWTVQESGRVMNSKGRSIYNAGYVTAIKKILSIIENGGSQISLN